MVDENPEHSPNADAIGSFLAVWTKAFAAGTACLYALGLVVTSVRFSQLGLLNVEFAKPVYVLTGFWTALPIVTALLVLVIFFGVGNLFEDDSRDFNYLTPWKRRFRKLPYCLLYTLVVTSALLTAGYLTLDFANKELMGFSGFGPDFFPFFVFHLASALCCWPLSRWFYVVLGPGVGRILFYGATSTIFGAYYVTVFAGHTYPAIPAQLGGGAPRIFEFAFTNSAIRGWVTGDTEDHHFVMCWVYAETPTAYIIATPNRSLVLPFAYANQLTKAVSDSPTQLTSFTILPKEAVSAAAVISFVGVDWNTGMPLKLESLEPAPSDDHAQQ